MITKGSVGGSSAQTINVSTATPAGIVSAINGANLGIEAQLLNTGDQTSPYTVVVSGQTGSANSFTLTAVDAAGAPIADLSFSNQLDVAHNAQFSLNGMAISRASNQVNDLIDGVTFNLFGATTGAARIELSRQTQSITDKLQGLVVAYNDLELTLKELGNRESEIEEVGGALANDSMLQRVRSLVHNYITKDSSTPSGAIRAARDVGLSFDRKGQLTLDEDKLSSALQNNFNDVVTLFSAGTNNKSVFSPAPSGVAGDAVVKIDAMLRSTGLINTQTQSANTKIDVYKAELSKLDDRLSQILARYTQQFSVMESFVGNTKSLQTSLKSTFDGMMATYSNKG